MGGGGRLRSEKREQQEEGGVGWDGAGWGSGVQSHQAITREEEGVGGLRRQHDYRLVIFMARGLLPYHAALLNAPEAKHAVGGGGDERLPSLLEKE